MKMAYQPRTVFRFAFAKEWKFSKNGVG